MSTHRRPAQKGFGKGIILSLLSVVTLVGVVTFFWPLRVLLVRWELETLVPGFVQSSYAELMEKPQQAVGQSVLSLRRDLLTLSHVQPPRPERWLAASAEKHDPTSPQKSAQNNSGRQHLSTPLTIDLHDHTLQFSPLDWSPRRPALPTVQQQNKDKDSKEKEQPALRTLPRAGTGKRPTAVSRAVFSAVNEWGSVEQLSRRAVPLQPGESVFLLPDGMSKRWGFEWNSELTLHHISFGATPDRRDAPGHLQVEPIYASSLPPLDSEGRVKPRSQQPSRASKQKPLLMTVEPDPALHFDVSPVPTVASVNLGPLLKRKNAQDLKSIKITWSEKSSGVLLLLGRTSLSKQTPPPSGFLSAEVDSLEWPAPILGKTTAALEKLVGSNELQTVHEVWPQRIENPAFTSTADASVPDARSTSKRTLLSQIASQFPTTVGVWVHGEGQGSLEPQQTPTASDMDVQVVLSPDQSGRIPGETLAQLASVVSAGHFVRLRFPWLPQDIKQISATAYVNTLLRASWPASRAATVLRSAEDQELLQQEELYLRLDNILVDLIRSVPQLDPSPSVLVQVARQPNELKRGIIQLSKDVPQGFAPGYASLAVRSRFSPDQSQAGATPLESPLTEIELLDWVQKRFEKKIREKKGRSAKRRKKKQEASTPKDLLVAEVEGQEGSLYVFRRGWVFLPQQENVGTNGHAARVAGKPLFGVPLEEVVAAKDRIYLAHLPRNEVLLHTRISGTGPKNRKLFVDLRSEFPVKRCSSSEGDLKLSQSALRSEGWMHIKARGKASRRSTHTDVVCLIDLAHSNPIKTAMKRRRRTAQQGSGKVEKEAVVSLSLRVSVDGKRVPMSAFQFGPYGESWEFVSSSSNVAHLDFKSVASRLLNLLPSLERERLSRKESDGKGSSGKAPHLSTHIHVWTSPAAPLPLEHPTQEDWQKEIENFVESRYELAEQLRSRRL